MNRISAKISSIESEGNLALVHLDAGGLFLSAIILDRESSLSYLKEGHTVQVLFKETEVSIASATSTQISLRNQIPGTVGAVEKGRLLSRVVLNSSVGEIIAVITTASAEMLNLKPGTEAVAMIKTNEVMLSD